VCVRVHVRVFKKKNMSPFSELHVEILSVLIPVHEALRHTSTAIIFPVCVHGSCACACASTCACVLEKKCHRF